MEECQKVLEGLVEIFELEDFVIVGIVKAPVLIASYAIDKVSIDMLCIIV